MFSLSTFTFEYSNLHKKRTSSKHWCSRVTSGFDLFWHATLARVSAKINFFRFPDEFRPKIFPSSVKILFFYSEMDASHPEIYLLYTAIMPAAPVETVGDAGIVKINTLISQYQCFGSGQFFTGSCAN
jgi:hypothetical protein